MAAKHYQRLQYPSQIVQVPYAGTRSDRSFVEFVFFWVFFSQILYVIINYPY